MTSKNLKSRHLNWTLFLTFKTRSSKLKSTVPKGPLRVKLVNSHKNLNKNKWSSAKTVFRADDLENFQNRDIWIEPHSLLANPKLQTLWRNLFQNEVWRYWPWQLHQLVVKIMSNQINRLVLERYKEGFMNLKRTNQEKMGHKLSS